MSGKKAKKGASPKQSSEMAEDNSAAHSSAEQSGEFKELRSLILTLGKDIKSNYESLKDQINKDRKSVKKQIEDMRVQIEASINKKMEDISEEFEENSRAIKDLENSNKELREQNDILKVKLESLTHSLNDQAEKINKLDSYSRRENLIFHGIWQSDQENCEARVKNVIDKMGVNGQDMKFDRCHRLTGYRPQPIIVRFNWYQDRMQVFSAKSKLANTKISISEDFPSDVIEKRRALYPIMKSARDSKRYAAIRGDKLVIGNDVYTVDTLHKLPADLDPANLCTKKHGNVVAFFGGHSPLSNFFKCNIEIDGKTYSSVEQYFQHQKCVFAEDIATAARILNTHSPAQCKQLGDSVTLDQENWLPKAKQVMKAGMMAKFTQNIRAKNFLLGTENSVLAEAGPNKTYGTGLKLSDPKNGTINDWNGTNVAGEILTSVRNELEKMN